MPPPFSGGIERWSLMVTQYVAGRTDTMFDLVDLSVRWRESYDLAVWKRALGGNLQLARDCIRFAGCLKRRPDVIHLTTPGGLATFRDNVISRIAAIAKVPVVYHLRFGRVPQVIFSHSFEARNMRATLRRVSCVMPLDSATEAALRKLGGRARIARVPNCIDLKDLPQQTPVDTERPTAMFLGNVLQTKGIPELLKAWTELNPAGWRLRIVGESDPKYQKELAARYPSPSVEYSGDKPHREAMELLAQASIFVFPSHTEGFPNAVLEAMALGKPIIATRVGAIPDMLEGGCGILISPGNSRELRDTVAWLIKDGRLRDELAGRARTRARDAYSIESVFRQYQQVWREAAQGRPGEQPAGVFGDDVRRHSRRPWPDHRGGGLRSG